MARLIAAWFWVRIAVRKTGDEREIAGANGGLSEILSACSKPIRQWPALFFLFDAFLKRRSLARAQKHS
jgi:hypothetical protein